MPDVKKKTSKPSQVVRFRVHRAADGWQGVICLPSAATCTTVQAKAATPRAALSRATALANEALQSPVLRALLPPQAGLALKAAGALAKAGPSVARAAARVLKSPGLRSLARLFG